MHNPENSKFYPLAKTYLGILEKAFPRRKFVIDWPEKHLRISVVEAFAYVQIAGPRTVTCHINDTVMHATSSTIVDKMQKTFEAETELRQRHTKQRTKIRAWLLQLDTTEMFANEEFVATHRPFSGSPKFAPVVTFAWKEIPDVPVIKITFNTYRNTWNGSNFRVDFGDTYHSFHTWAEVLSFFNGTDVFKYTDRSLSENDFKLMPEKEQASDRTMVIRYTDLEIATPYMLLMNARELEVVEVMTQMRAWYAQADEEAVFQTFMPKKTIERFIRFKCHPELQWDFHYRDNAQELPESI